MPPWRALCRSLHVVAKSFSDDAYVIANKVYLWPEGFTAQAYEKIFADDSILQIPLRFRPRYCAVHDSGDAPYDLRGLSVVAQAAERPYAVDFYLYVHHVLPWRDYSRLYADEQPGNAGQHMVTRTAAIVQCIQSADYEEAPSRAVFRLAWRNRQGLTEPDTSEFY